MTVERAEEIMKAVEKTGDVNEMLAKTPEEATEILTKAGYEFTLDEITEFGEGIKEAAGMNIDEFSDEDLEKVSGGGRNAYWVLTALQTGCIAGAILCSYAELCCW